MIVTLVGVGVAFAASRLRGGPDLGRVIYATKSGVFFRDLASGAQERVARLPSDTLDASPDQEGRWVAYTRKRGDLWLLNVETKQRWQLSEQLTAALGWTPRGRLVAHEVLAEQELVALDPQGRRSELLLRGFPGGKIVWLDERRFFWSGRGDVVVVTVGEQRPAFALRKIIDDAAVVAIAPDGKELLYVSKPGSAKPRLVVAALKETRPGKPRLVFRGLAYRAGVSPQGYVAFSGRDRRNRNGSWVLRGAGRAPRRISKRQAEALSWTKDGASLVFLVDGVVVAHDFRTDRQVRLTPRAVRVLAFGVVP